MAWTIPGACCGQHACQEQDHKGATNGESIDAESDDPLLAVKSKPNQMALHRIRLEETVPIRILPATFRNNERDGLRFRVRPNPWLV